ncbi:MAG: cytochrome b/b6 domain-containing protein [Nitrospirae bacterium]|nr:cytochrome b/b6 domain-containing protein [Nitrospirota bacterium]
MLKKVCSLEILVHWTKAISFFILVISGFGFMFHMEGVGSAFGGFNQMKTIHNWVGVVFAGALFLTIFHYLPVALKFTSDDVTWLTKAGGYLSKKAQLPPQDEINAGQRCLSHYRPHSHLHGDTCQSRDTADNDLRQCTC